MKLPVVFIHIGNSAYLFDTFYQLKQSNPDAEIYLIGTKESEVYGSMLNHISMDQYMDGANSFRSIYKHFSTNSEAFELMCIQRWFVLKEFMERHSIQKCFYLDSDVLLYTPIAELSKFHEHSGMTLCGISGHSNFIDKDVLRDFCSFVKSSYTGEDSLAALELHYKVFVQKHGAGGVSDMTLLSNYAAVNADKVVNLYMPDSNETFDPSFVYGGEYFVMKGNIRKIFFNKSIPYGLKKNHKESIRFHTLHFQGGNIKKILADYIPVKSVSYYLYKNYFKAILFLQKAASKMNF